MKILVTAFEPFGEDTLNAALEAAKMVRDEIAGAKIVKVTLPVAFGKALEAARALMDYAHSAWGFKRFIAQCDSANESSYRLMERLGMRRISCTGGRKNRSSDEERQELTYEIMW